jgi:hypothetical protein
MHLLAAAKRTSADHGLYVLGEHDLIEIKRVDIL